MKVVCEHCGAVYRIPEEKLTREVHKATCRRCGHRMVIRRLAATEAVAPPPPPSAVPHMEPAPPDTAGVPTRAHDPFRDLLIVLIACVTTATGAMILAIRPAGPSPLAVAGLLLSLWGALAAILVLGTGHMGRRPSRMGTSVGVGLLLAGIVTAVLHAPWNRFLGGSHEPGGPVVASYVPGTLGSSPPMPAHGVPASVVSIQLRNDVHIKNCFVEHERATGERPSVTLRFTLDPSGAATAASLQEPAYRGSALERCLVASVGTIAFPPFEGDPVPVSHPFRF
ncbi:MAG: zinc-ribbon domain-containing protein [Deltaproteobacteria bacterium]|nr:zinc-ribbon domain-containing protein [Deltaproteobacteria bacterium]